MDQAHFTMGMPLGVLLPVLRRMGLDRRPTRLLRVLLLLQAGVWTSCFNLLERRLHGGGAPPAVPRDPIFIVGPWRTGSTFLHQLLARDPAFTAPTLVQCMWPGCFRSARVWATLAFRLLLPEHRPQDNVRLGADEPQEDEWALVRLTGWSPLLRLVAGENRRYFLVAEDDMLPADPAARAAWGRALGDFVARIAQATGRRPVLKNPFHSCRIPALEALFPEARYIHILRDPGAAIPSTLHLWNVLGPANVLRGEWSPPDPDDVIDVYGRMVRRVEADLASIPRSRWTEVRYEDLEADPLGTLRRLYDDLALPFTPDTESSVRGFLAGVAGYRKNRYPEDPALQARIRERLAHPREVEP